MHILDGLSWASYSLSFITIGFFFKLKKRDRYWLGKPTGIFLFTNMNSYIVVFGTVIGFLVALWLM